MALPKSTKTSTSVQRSGTTIPNSTTDWPDSPVPTRPKAFARLRRRERPRAGPRRDRSSDSPGSLPSLVLRKTRNSLCHPCDERCDGRLEHENRRSEGDDDDADDDRVFGRRLTVLAGTRPLRDPQQRRLPTLGFDLVRRRHRSVRCLAERQRCKGGCDPLDERLNRVPEQEHDAAEGNDQDAQDDRVLRDGLALFALEVFGLEREDAAEKDLETIEHVYLPPMDSAPPTFPTPAAFH